MFFQCKKSSVKSIHFSQSVYVCENVFGDFASVCYLFSLISFAAAYCPHSTNPSTRAAGHVCWEET